MGRVKVFAACITALLLLLGLCETQVQSTVVADPTVKCPETMTQLEELLATDNWTPDNLRYKVQVLPDYFSENYTDTNTPIAVETNTTLKVSLQKNASDPTVLTCDIVLSSYRIERPGTYLNWRKPQNVATGGSLWYEGESYQTRWYTLLHSLFPVGSEKLSNLKARYTFSVAHPSSEIYTILLNMPLEREEPFEEKVGWVWNHYKESPPIWTDQVVILILAGGETKKVEFKDVKQNNRTISLYWRPSSYQPVDDQEQQRVNECILQWNAKLLTHFESRFGVKYPLDKLDLVATNSLGSRSTVDTAEKYLGIGRSAKAAHFGAKSGICTLPTVEDVRPWVIGVLQQWMGFVQHSWHAGFSENAMWGLLGYFLREGVTTVMGDTLDEEQLFTYTLARRKKRSRFATNPSKPGLKEGAVLQMLEDILTKPVFDNGIVDNFMAKLNDTESTLSIADFYGALEKTTETHNKTHLFPDGVNITEIFKSWMVAPGKPLVRVNLDKEDPTVLIFTQTVGTAISYDDHPPIRTREPPVVEERNGSWIPLEVKSGSESRFTWLSPNTSQTLQVKLKSDVREADFFWINSNIKSYFRVLYDQPLTELITKQLTENPNVVQWRLRVKLISEYFQFAKDNETDIENALRMLSYLENETNPGVWNAVLNGILLDSWQLDVFGFTKQELQRFIGSLIDKALVRIGPGSLNSTVYRTEDTINNVSVTRDEIMKGCISTKTPGCIEYSKQLMTFWQGHPELGNPFDRYGDNSAQAQCMSLRGSVPGDKLYNFYVNMNKVGEDTNGTSYCRALLCTGNETLLLDIFSKSLSNVTDTDKKIECSSVNAVSIGKEFSQLISPVFKMLKEAVLNDTENTQKMVDFLHAFYNYGLDDTVLKELDNFYEEYGKKHKIDWDDVTYSNKEFNAGPLKDAFYFAKSTHGEHARQAPKYSDRLLQWIDKRHL